MQTAEIVSKKILLGNCSAEAYCIIAYYSIVFISESISEENNRQKSEILIHVEI